MDAYILDEQFQTIRLIDAYESFIWTDRYYAYGDFELYLPMNSELLPYLKLDNYIWLNESEHMMIIEKLYIESDPEQGNHLTVSGRSLESILNRRIVWNQTTYSGDLQTVIKKILTDSIINPSIADRKISNFIFNEIESERIKNIKVEAQYTGDNVYEIIQTLCEDNDVGFKVTLNSSNQFVFSLYDGEDRSYNQSVHPYVIFSPKFENLINSNYLESNEILKNITLVAGEGEGAARRTITVGSGTGLLRRELFTDARDISSQVDGGTISPTEYNNQLTQRGTENLKDYKMEIAFEGEAETTILFVYGRDFFIGDIVETSDAYTHEGRSRIIEFIWSQDDGGKSSYPTFKVIEEDSK